MVDRGRSPALAIPPLRSVSPLGASRFEKPYDPPPVPRMASVRASAQHRSSPTTTPTSPTSTAHGSHYSQPSAASSALRSDTTAASSPHDDPDHAVLAAPPAPEKRLSAMAGSPDSPACALPPAADEDEWYARFRSDPDLSLAVSDECPDRATLAAVYDLPVFDAAGTPRPFGSLYDPAYALHPRQLVLFVRHFYCGACQAYLQALARGITKEDYFAIPIPTSIIVVGCGQPDLIPHYKKFTGCPFPIFADPSRQLFRKLGMVVTAHIGRTRPDYMHDISAPAWLAGQLTTIRRSLRDPDGIRARDVLRGGNPLQIGGEFLFEDGEVVWCHRMRNFRNHAEVAVLRQVLGLDE